MSPPPTAADRQVKYGYGVVDKNGDPWWDESCVCQDRGPLLEALSWLNDGLADDPRQPYRVVALTYKVGR